MGRKLCKPSRVELVMTFRRPPILAVVAFAALGACNKPGPVDETIPDEPVVTGEASTTVTGGPPAAGTSNDEAGVIPAALRGRWGLTPADCEPGRNDAKGLIVISADKLTFYESRATPATSIEANSTGISGNWDFSGEGQQWSKYVSLTLNGTTLNRTERAPMASYEYAKCD